MALKMEGRHATSPLRLLLVDDSAMMCRVAKTVLREDALTAEVEVVLAGDGVAALEQLRASSFDLMVTDIAMPEMDGVELIAAVQADAALASLPIVVLSSSRLHIRINSAGAFAFCLKSEMHERLVTAIGTVMRGESHDQASFPNKPETIAIAKLTVVPATAFAGPGIRVLVVDESATRRKLLSRVLQRLEVEVETADSGRDALAEIESSRFHMVVMDTEMTDIDGLELTQILRAAEPATQHTVVIAYTTNSDRVCVEAAGMDGYISKRAPLPSVKAELTSWIARVRQTADDNQAA